jgi:repressor LexA
MNSSLTKKQQQVLVFIEQFAVKQGYPPTLTEIAGHFGITIGTVQDHVEALKRKGCLRQKPNTARGFALTRKVENIPIYGRVAAGNPIFATENIEGYWQTPDSNPSDFFALRVVGDSMIEAGIMDGDTLKIRKQKTAEDKDIVVALIGDEATVKRFRKKYGAIFLEPANPKYPVMKNIEFEILGKIVELKRRF